MTVALPETETRPVEAPPKTKTTADVLRHAALLIEERGWCQGDAVDAHGHLCAVGALSLAMYGDPECMIPSEISNALRRSFDSRYSVPIWNDVEGRTAAEVIAALRAAAELAS
jgi:hypothetical protein